MNIDEQFNRIAKVYDTNRRKFIPCFDDFYGATTDFIAANIARPERILDLGAGTGLLTYCWYKNFGMSEYVLADIADEMLNVARERFSCAENVSFEAADYSKTFPQGKFDCVISALSIHHLEHEDKRKLFSRVYNRLPENGIFVNYDQFCGGTAKMNAWFDSYWIGGLESGDLAPKDIEQWKERRKLDREISVETEVRMLGQCGFSEVKCVYSYQKFSVIVAIK